VTATADPARLLSPGYREVPAGRPGLACLWLHVAGPVQRPARILPDACVDLIWIAGSGVHLAGPDTTAALAELAPQTVVAGVRFTPGAGGPALGRRLDGDRDARVPLPGLAAPDLEPREALRALAAAAARMVAAAPPDAAVAEAARRLADPAQRVEDLAADLGLSDRQLRRRCLAAAGHTPKVLQRVLRFRAFVAAADADPQPDLARLAAEHGYADQAHLTNECTRLAGMPPAALLSDRRGASATAGA
jgi:AraC-like DNA-binding protein